MPERPFKAGPEMRVLAIETSTMLGGVAVMDSEAGLVSEVKTNVKTGHSERLMTEVDQALRGCGLELGDIDTLAVAVGPGSFTGLRIGIGTAKGLSFSTGLPVVAVPTLEAFASQLCFSPHPVCPMLDARKGEVYAAAFAFEGEVARRIIPETSIEARRFALSLLESHKKAVFTGEGALLYRNALVEALGEGAVFAPPHLFVPSPASVALIGLRKALRDEFTDPAGLKPFYIRKSEAEIKNP